MNIPLFHLAAAPPSPPTRSSAPRSRPDSRQLDARLCFRPSPPSLKNDLSWPRRSHVGWECWDRNRMKQFSLQQLVARKKDRSNIWLEEWRRYEWESILIRWQITWGNLRSLSCRGLTVARPFADQTFKRNRGDAKDCHYRPNGSTERQGYGAQLPKLAVSMTLEHSSSLRPPKTDFVPAGRRAAGVGIVWRRARRRLLSL